MLSNIILLWIATTYWIYWGVPSIPWTKGFAGGLGHLDVKSKTQNWTGLKNYSKQIHWYKKSHLVGGLEHFLFFHILGIIIPTDELIFFRGVDIPPTRHDMHPYIHDILKTIKKGRVSMSCPENDGFLKWRYSQPSSSYLSDFPWNKPSSYWSFPIPLKLEHYIVWSFPLYSFPRKTCRVSLCFPMFPSIESLCSSAAARRETAVSTGRF